MGSDPHIIIGQEMLYPRDGNEKDEGELTGGKRLIIKDAIGLFKTEGRKEEFRKDNVRVNVWDLTGFQMEGVEKSLRVLNYVEQHLNEKEERIVWVVTSLMDTDYIAIWTIMHKRWDIEENGFHQLKTYYHAKHCFEHAAAETIFMLNIIAFNLREMYLFRRMQTFRKTKMTRREVSIKIKDDLLLHNYRKLIYDDG